MNKLVMIFGLLLLTVAGLQAQRTAQRGSSARQDRQTAIDLVRANRTDLGITDRQMTQLEELSAETRSALQELRQGDQPQEDKRAAGRDMLNEQNQKLTAILTPEQQTKLKELRRAQQPDRTDARRKMVAKHKGKGMAFIRANQAELGISADQMTKLEALAAETQTAATAIRDGSQSKEEKQAAGKELMGKQKQQMAAILTPEQQTKMKAMLREKKQNRSERN